MYLLKIYRYTNIYIYSLSSMENIVHKSYSLSKYSLNLVFQLKL